MSLNYALVTSSSLPDEVKSSPHYMEVDKAQWLDLVDYSRDLVDHDPSQKILFLIVAKGTEEQEAEDARLKEAEEKRIAALEDAEEADKAAAELRAKKAKEKEAQQAQLRSKSKSIFNALYGR